MIVNDHSQLPDAIENTPDGSPVNVATAELKELGERAANRMMRQDIVFIVAGTAAANDDEYKATTNRWDRL